MYTVVFLERPWGAAFNVQWQVVGERVIEDNEALEKIQLADQWAYQGKAKGKGRMVLVRGGSFKGAVRSGAALKKLQTVLV